MKKITLHGAAVRNDGGYVDAGETLDIGAKPEQIIADRARELINRGTAVSVVVAQSDAKTALA